jgi:hypothetical protein
MANGKEPAAAGQMQNNLNFAICHLKSPYWAGER